MGGDFTGKQQNSAKGIYALAGRIETIPSDSMHIIQRELVRLGFRIKMTNRNLSKAKFSIRFYLYNLYLFQLTQESPLLYSLNYKAFRI